MLLYSNTHTKESIPPLATASSLFFVVIIVSPFLIRYFVPGFFLLFTHRPIVHFFFLLVLMGHLVIWCWSVRNDPFVMRWWTDGEKCCFLPSLTSVWRNNAVWAAAALNLLKAASFLSISSSSSLSVNNDRKETAHSSFFLSNIDGGRGGNLERVTRCRHIGRTSRCTCVCFVVIISKRRRKKKDCGYIWKKSIFSHL